MTAAARVADEHQQRALMTRMKRLARQHPWSGETPVDHRHRTLVHSPCDPDVVTSIILTLDYGTHASGWWRNSDYDRCWHLSLASHDLTDGRIAPHPQTSEPAEIRVWAAAAFGIHRNKLWIEPAASVLDPHRLPSVTHLRLFVDRHLTPIMPEGEVHTLKPWADGRESPEKVFR